MVRVTLAYACLTQASDLIEAKMQEGTSANKNAATADVGGKSSGGGGGGGGGGGCCK